MDWKECNEKKLVKKVNLDLNLINSLIETSKNKEKSASLLILDDITSVSIISLYYDSLRELLEAIAIKNSYKIYNHECYTCFLKKILKLHQFLVKYDSLRKLRNELNYYGEKISLSEAEILINDLKKLIIECKKILLVK